MKTILVIPFYGNEELIENFGKFFIDNKSQYKLFARIIVINDNPKSDNKCYLADRARKFGFEYLENLENIGYLKTSNIGFNIAKEQNAGLVLINSDALPYGDCFSELISCLADVNGLGCISPRSNNATICNLLDKPFFIESKIDLEEITKIFEDSREVVSRICYSPVVNGFCICIKYSVVQLFGGFDVEFNPGYEEENEYCLRISQSGIKVGIANHAFVGHLEGRSFGLKPGRSELKAAQNIKLINKYKYYNGLLNSYGDTLLHKSYEFTIKCLVRGKKTVLVDARSLGSYYNGTNILIVNFVKALAELDFKIEILASLESCQFHGITNLDNIVRIDSVSEKFYYYGIKIGQPFDHSSLCLVPIISLNSINIFFDTIALDCPQLSTSGVDIRSLWACIEFLYSDVFFISSDVKFQYEAYFGKMLSNHHAVLLPIEINSDIQLMSRDKCLPDKFALVVGNNFLHKGIEIALLELPCVPGLKYIVTSDDFNIDRGDLIYMSPGAISVDLMRSIQANCEYIIFPSFSEGYGYPVLDAINFNKIIYCRPLASFKQIYLNLNIDSRKFVKFVEDFKSVGLDCAALDGDILEHKKDGEIFFESYVSYVGYIMGSVQRKTAEQYLNLNKIKFSKYNSMSECDRQIANLNQFVTERDGQINNLNQSVTERDGQIDNLNQSVTELDGQIVRLTSSNSWRLTKPLRFLRRIQRGAVKTVFRS